MRLIDADALEPDADYDDGNYWAVSMGQIQFAPTIDPVRKGKWIKGTGENGVSTSLFCSECNYENRHWYEWNYCPNCGAKMEGCEQDG